MLYAASAYCMECVLDVKYNYYALLYVSSHPSFWLTPLWKHRKTCFHDFCKHLLEYFVSGAFLSPFHLKAVITLIVTRILSMMNVGSDGKYCFDNFTFSLDITVPSMDLCRCHSKVNSFKVSSFTFPYTFSKVLSWELFVSTQIVSKWTVETVNMQL